MHKIIIMKSISIEDYARAVFFFPDLLNDNFLAPTVLESVIEINQKISYYKKEMEIASNDPQKGMAMYESISYLENLRKQLIA
jgi:hypothetical protein